MNGAGAAPRGFSVIVKVPVPPVTTVSWGCDPPVAEPCSARRMSLRSVVPETALSVIASSNVHPISENPVCVLSAWMKVAAGEAVMSSVMMKGWPDLKCLASASIASGPLGPGGAWGCYEFHFSALSRPAFLVCLLRRSGQGDPPP